MTPLVHNYSALASKTVYQDTTDVPSVGDQSIVYQYNSHGFRTREFDQPIEITCFGCSFTMGTGLDIADTWPSQLEQLTGLATANFGHAGSSNDTGFRFASYYLDLLRPKYAVWFQTFKNRFELLDDHVPFSLNILPSDSTNPCSNDYYTKTWFASDSNADINAQKNELAFRELCRQYDINCLILKIEDVFPVDRARDQLHPGPQTHKLLAERIYKELFSQ